LKIFFSNKAKLFIITTVLPKVRLRPGFTLEIVYYISGKNIIQNELSVFILSI